MLQKSSSPLSSTLVSTLLFLALVVVSSEISEECRQDTEPLLADTNLAIAQSVVFEDYTESFNDKCDLGLGTVDCSIEFEGDERTYRALCEGQGGQLYKRPAVLKCLLGSLEYDLGYIPTCVGASCNITNIAPGDVVTEQVQTFLDNLTIVGCSADASAAAAKLESGMILSSIGGVTVAVATAFGLVSGLF